MIGYTCTVILGVRCGAKGVALMFTTAEEIGAVMPISLRTLEALRDE